MCKKGNVKGCVYDAIFFHDLGFWPYFMWVHVYKMYV